MKVSNEQTPKSTTAGASLADAFDEAARFIAILTGKPARSAEVIFQTFTDGEKSKPDPLAKVIVGTLPDCWPELQRINAKGAGVFVTVNEMRGRRRGKKHFKTARAIFQEDDTGDAPMPALSPHIVVESSPGKFHRYWLTETGDREAWEAGQQTMVNDFGSDPNAKDAARVLRLPGTLHQKNRAAPFLVRLVDISPELPYAWSEITTIIPPAVIEQPAISEAAGALHAFREEDLRLLLAHISENTKRGNWLNVIWALRRAWRAGSLLKDESIYLKLADEYSRDSEKYKGTEDVRDKMREADDRDGSGIGFLWNEAIKGGFEPTAAMVARLHNQNPENDFDDMSTDGDASESPLDGYFAYLPQHQYIDRKTRQLVPSPSIDGNLRGIAGDGNLKPSAWLDKHRAVNQMTWAPGKGEVIDDHIVDEGGWIKCPGKRVYNLYREPPVLKGDPAQAAPWLAHLERVYPNDFEHLIKWFAQRVQRPGDKINHALVIAGNQGIGKETLLQPVQEAIGAWNMVEIAPHQMIGQFNSWAKSVILRVSEARDLGPIDRFAFYERSKTCIAAPPDVLRVNEKHMKEYAVFNVMGVIITTNHKLDGIYLPAGDRRHYVAWSKATIDSFDADYWNELWGWYKSGGYGHVAAYLRALDLSGFDPKAPPPKTDAFYRIVEAGNSPEESELSDLLAEMGDPDAVTTDQLKTACAMTEDDALAALFSPKGLKALPHKLEASGYETHRNPNEQKGRWLVAGKRLLVYVRKELQVSERSRAVALLCRCPNVPMSRPAEKVEDLL